MKKTALAIFLIFLCSLPCYGDFGGEYYQILHRMLSGEKNEILLAETQKLLSKPGIPDWGRLGLTGDLAYFYLKGNDSAKALQAFEKAVALGLNDYYAIHIIPEYRPLFENKKFKDLYGRMRISKADMLELQWIYAELSKVHHDASMMITENMGRKDRNYTRVPQAAIPTRQPQSLNIILLREALRMLQRYQREIVMQSDMSRINHLMQMEIIGNMPGGDNSRPDSWAQTNKQNQITQSALDAERRARQREQDVANRQFSLPPGTSTALEPCPPLGYIPLRNQAEQTPQNADNPVNNGDDTPADDDDWTSDDDTPVDDDDWTSDDDTPVDDDDWSDDGTDDDYYDEE